MVKATIILLKNKFNLLKVLGNPKAIIKFAMAMGAMSANFLLLRWTVGYIQKLKEVKILLSQYSQLKTIFLYSEYIIGGVLSSRAAMWLDSGDRNLLKLIVYMRAFDSISHIIVY